MVIIFGHHDRRLRLSNNKQIKNPPANRPQGHRFLVLDSWRGICAVGVAIFHMNFAGPAMPSPSFKGYLFVDYFFVLSGFVISAAYLERLTDRAALVHFIIRRFGRIYPVHLIILIGCLASVLVLEAKRPPAEPGSSQETILYSFLANLLLVQSFTFYKYLVWNAPNWSISFEFYAYLIFGAASLLIGRLLWILVIPALAICAAIAIVRAPTIEVTVNIGVLRALLGFFTGYLVYRLWRRWRLTPAPGRGTAAELAVLSAILLFFTSVGETRFTWLAPALFAAAIYVFAHENGFVSRLLRQRPFLGLGTLSYSLYMVHYPLYRGIDIISKRVGGDMPAPVLMAFLALCGALAVAAAVHLLIERPGMRLFGVWAERARSALTKRRTLPSALTARSASQHLR